MDKQSVVLKGWDPNEGVFRVNNPACIDRIGGIETSTIRELLETTEAVLHGLCFEEFLVPEELLCEVSKYLRYVYKLLVFRPHKLTALRDVQLQAEVEHPFSLARKLSENEEAELFTYFINLQKDFKDINEICDAPQLDVEDPKFLRYLENQEGRFPHSSEYLLHSGIGDPTLGFE